MSPEEIIKRVDDVKSYLEIRQRILSGAVLVALGAMHVLAVKLFQDMKPTRDGIGIATVGLKRMGFTGQGVTLVSVIEDAASVLEQM